MLSPLRVLTVEDDAVQGLDLKAAILNLGHDVVGHAYTGGGAIVMAQRLKPDVATMDILLAGRLDGIEAAKEITTRFGVGILFITGQTDATIIARARAMAPVGILTKPYSLVRLADYMKEAAERRK
jgi:two-component system, response regulator PdtaR